MMTGFSPANDVPSLFPSLLKSKGVKTPIADGMEAEGSVGLKSGYQVTEIQDTSSRLVILLHAAMQLIALPAGQAHGSQAGS